jgi:p-methyltransferase
MTSRTPECIVIGYNEPEFRIYEQMLARYRRNSEAYRDLRMSFVELDGQKLDCCGLLNYAWRLAYPASPVPPIM